LDLIDAKVGPEGKGDSPPAGSCYVAKALRYARTIFWERLGSWREALFPTGFPPVSKIPTIGRLLIKPTPALCGC